MTSLWPWVPAKDGNPILREMYERHYSCRRYRDGRHLLQLEGPGQKMVLTTPLYSALWVWRKFIDKSGQKGINCACFQNESSALSSCLILAAEEWAWGRWPGERLYTYINPKKIKSTNPGYCFLKAGWKKCGRTKKGLLIYEKLPTKGGDQDGAGRNGESVHRGAAILEGVLDRGED